MDNQKNGVSLCLFGVDTCNICTVDSCFDLIGILVRYFCELFLWLCLYIT